MPDALVWGSFTQAALDAAYNNMAAVPDSAGRLANWEARSAALRARLPGELGIAYGPGTRNRIDIFRCGRDNAPLMAFIHGGWWQRNSKEVFACMAEGPLAHGLDVAMIGYTLAPEARLTQIAGEIGAALDHLAAHQAGHGRAGHCLLSGWSAGGHLTALLLGHAFVTAGLSISGVFDLEPIRQSYINDKLRLDAAEAADMSPARLPPTGKPLTLAFGLNELPELQRQSKDFAQALLRRGQPCKLLALPGHHHFSILEELAGPAGVLAREAAAMARAACSKAPP